MNELGLRHGNDQDATLLPKADSSKPTYSDREPITDHSIANAIVPEGIENGDGSGRCCFVGFEDDNDSSGGERTSLNVEELATEFYQSGRLPNLQGSATRRGGWHDGTTKADITVPCFGCYAVRTLGVWKGRLCRQLPFTKQNRLFTCRPIKVLLLISTLATSYRPTRLGGDGEATDPICSGGCFWWTSAIRCVSLSLFYYRQYSGELPDLLLFRAICDDNEDEDIRERCSS